METYTKLTTGAVTILSIVALIFGAGLIGEDNVYTCGEEIAIKCEKLSAVNDLGLQTRCYFFSEELNRSTYKVCRTGWNKFENNYEEINKSLDLICDDKKFIRECTNENNQTIIRIKYE